MERKYPKLTSKIIRCLLFFAIFGCSQKKIETQTFNETNKSNVISNQNIFFVADTTVNGKLKLENFESAISLAPNSKITLEENLRESPVAIFKNSDDSQYLSAYEYEGSTKNSFQCFEVGYLSYEPKIKNLRGIKTQEKYFFSESDLHLGNTKQELIKKKGKDFEMITYRLEDY